ncbi:hypothetical protein [Nocardia sp. NPDC051832]|uniref:hypothetical protein n=1 Tax=Nocardia sp. NPDC051832 TaxID=3155673 RepID=UPI00342EC94D
MADIYPHDLAETSLAVLRRRAETAGLPLNDYLRHELVALARRRNSMDTVVEFLDEQGWRVDPTVDTGALALIQVYDLPTDVVAVWCRRAYAAKLPIETYVRQELTASARRATVEDALTELAAVQAVNPDLDIDMAAVADAVRYARAW